MKMIPRTTTRTTAKKRRTKPSALREKYLFSENFCSQALAILDAMKSKRAADRMKEQKSEYWRSTGCLYAHRSHIHSGDFDRKGIYALMPSPAAAAAAAHIEKSSQFSSFFFHFLLFSLLRFIRYAFVCLFVFYPPSSTVAEWQGGSCAHTRTHFRVYLCQILYVTIIFDGEKGRQRRTLEKKRKRNRFTALTFLRFD